MWFSRLTLLDDLRIIVVMIGATASDDVGIFENSNKVARYPLNSMDFIEFNGSDSLTASV
jgi:hypothetical protein